MGDLNTNNLLTFSCAKITGQTLLFHKFDPPALALENAVHNTWDGKGNIQANNGGAKNALHGEWGLERVVDKAGDLYTWFENTNKSGRDSQKDNVTVTILAPDGQTTVGTWTFNNTTPVSYGHAAHDANSNAILTESIRFYSTEIIYKPGP
jgi:hypothetical protein